MDIILIPALKAIFWALGFYINIIIIAVIFEWLKMFNIINTSNKYVWMIGDFLYKATAPVYRKIRGIIPPLGNFDLSPLILIIFIYFLQEVILQIIYRLHV